MPASCKSNISRFTRASTSKEEHKIKYKHTIDPTWSLMVTMEDGTEEKQDSFSNLHDSITCMQHRLIRIEKI